MKLVRRLNQPLSPNDSDRGHDLQARGPAADDEWLVILAFSGGGTRAAALAHGVLEELARTTFRWGQNTYRMLDEVDAISAVSGGSFTAAYYALHGDRLFADFEDLFLKRDIQGALWRHMAWPKHWYPLMTKQLGRSDLAADYYDQAIFGGATFGDLLAVKDRPNLIINATDMVTGRPFAFTQRFFDLIGSDLTSLPLGRAVAASSAAPLLLSPLTLRNYAGQGLAQSAACVEHIRSSALVDGAPEELTRNLVSYLDAEDRPFIHLVDGGVADNLGLRGLLDVSALNGGFDALLERWELGHVRKIAVVVVNAAAHHDTRWNRGSNPDVVDVFQALSERMTQLTSSRTITDLKAEMEQWRRAGPPGGGADGRSERAFHLVDVSFDRIEDPAERTFFYDLPTTLSLPAATVERLREVGGRLLRESVEFQRVRAGFEAAGRKVRPTENIERRPAAK
ncbi:MAG: patatin-like phospholipase family protein [Verrucomicrobia bacterium]|nr:patatin-like phospholipase family protein [Verrucomicrobiota bacterium]